MSTQVPEGLKLDPGTELSSHRTALSLERTLMSADQTQMSVLRTSLSLIGFGFTIFEIFKELGKELGINYALRNPTRNLSIVLIVLGVTLLISGTVNRFNMMKDISRRRQSLYEDGLLRTPSVYRTSPNMVVSILLIINGILVLFGIVTHIGPFD